MTPTAILNHRGISYKLDSISDEPINETYERLWKIIQHCKQPTTDHLYHQLIKISCLWYYKRKYQCQYPSTTETLIKLFN